MASVSKTLLKRESGPFDLPSSESELSDLGVEVGCVSMVELSSPLRSDSEDEFEFEDEKTFATSFVWNNNLLDNS